MAGKLALEFHPEAVAELERAISWYNQQRLGLGESFLQEITTALTRIQHAPNTWPEYKRGTRRFLVQEPSSGRLEEGSEEGALWPSHVNSKTPLQQGFSAIQGRIQYSSLQRIN